MLPAGSKRMLPNTLKQVNFEVYGEPSGIAGGATGFPKTSTATHEAVLAVTGSL